MEPEGSLPHLQAPAACSYPEPDQCSSRLPILRLEDPRLILSSHLRQGLQSGLYPSGLPTKYPVYTSPVLRTYNKPRQHNSFRFDHPNNIW